jgi:hypothetical protein
MSESKMKPRGYFAFFDVLSETETARPQCQ